ncbi:MAG: UDP-N-acetylmuramate dehydrogenase [Deltaproteobacteria bacterium]|nr:UDP-N-acetylmuramate dehydrogenase [Deltaproteobacteria bacterium]
MRRLTAHCRLDKMDTVDELKLISGLKVKLNEPLAPYTSIKIGGPADYFLAVEDRLALARTLELLCRHGIPFCLLGQGSNVLVSDRGVRGAVLRLGREFKEALWTEDNGAVVALVGAAYPVSRLVREAARRGYSGLEFAEGIPGSVGGALVMNAGAYGSEIEKIVDRVEGVTAQGEAVGLERGQMLFTYRSSNLPPGTIVTRVHLRLTKDRAEAVSQRIRDLVTRRKKSQPSGYPNSGSMFRNPPGDFAGRLIEAAGLKGRKIGTAQISERHANFIVNLGGAKADEVRGLMELARAEVRKRFGVELEPEVRLLGEWPEENTSGAYIPHRRNRTG